MTAAIRRRGRILLAIAARKMGRGGQDLPVLLLVLIECRIVKSIPSCQERYIDFEEAVHISSTGAGGG